jgi:nucleotide-binding universal stress UspA family protein/predicted transcriptional regulator
MRVQDVMTRKVLTVEGDDTVERAGAMMKKAGVHQLVVRGRRGRVAGVIGAADLRAAPESGAVADFMASKLLIVRPGTSLGSAAALMRANSIGSLPVLTGTRLVGIVTVSDMLDVLDDVDGQLDRTAARDATPKLRRVRYRSARRPVAPGLFRNILVATDLTPGSMSAVTYAKRLAHDERAGLHILYVIPDPVVRNWSTEKYGSDRNRELDMAWQKATKQLAAIPLRRVKTERPVQRSVAIGEAIEQIVGYAKRHEVDLIVLGIRRRQAPDDIVTGTTAAGVLRLASCPVLTVLSRKARRRAVAA